MIWRKRVTRSAHFNIQQAGQTAVPSLDGTSNYHTGKAGGFNL
jgi:hypothetical protein